MQVQVAETGPCSRSITIQVPAAAIREHVDAMYDSANQQVRMKGFRPGKVPRKLLEKQFSASILQEAKEQIVQRYLNEACRDKQITPVGRIMIEKYEELKVQLDAALEFTVNIDVRPQFDIGETKGLEIETYATEVTDEEIESALKEIANQKRSIAKVDEAAQKGDFVKVDLRFLDENDGEIHQRKGVQLNTNIPIAGVEPAAFEAALVGAKAGAPVELALTFPANFEKDAYRGKPGKAVLDVKEVLRVTAPAIDDEMAKGLDFDSLASLREDLRTRIGSEKDRIGKIQQEDQCLQQLLDRHTFGLPGSLIDEQQLASLRQFAARLEQSGMQREDIEKKLEESKGEARTDAERRVRLFFLIEGVARQQKLFVTENDVEGEVRKIAQSNGVAPQAVVEHLEKNNQMGELRLALLERKVRDFLRENARLVDKKAS